MKEIVKYLLKIANELDEINLVRIASRVDNVANLILKEAQIPAKQPQIQEEPIVMPKESEKEFVEDKKEEKKKKRKKNYKGVKEGEDFLVHKKMEPENE